MVVIILKVDPGGWGAEKACPASARTSPLRASRTAMPPERPASAETAVSCRPVSIVVFTGAPGFGSPLARIRAEPVSSETASSEPPGLPARRSLKACSRPLTPTGVSAEKPWRSSAGRSSSSAVPTSPVTSIAELPSGCSRASASPSASGRAVGGEDRRPRRQLDLVLEVLVAAQAGEDEARVPGDAAVLVGERRGRPRPGRRRPSGRRSRPGRPRPRRPRRRRRASRLRASAWSPSPPRRGRRS